MNGCPMAIQVVSLVPQSDKMNWLTPSPPSTVCQLGGLIKGQADQSMSNDEVLRETAQVLVRD